MRTLRTVAALSAVLALASCDLPRTIAGSAFQAPVSTATVTAPSTPTVTAPVPQTVFVPPVTVAPAGVAASSQWYAQPGWINAQPWIAINPAPGQTPCQWLHAAGYSYAQAYAAWAQNGYPASWSATNDGYPCQKSYGMQH
ncbi:hypothetical protein H4696_008694 [Amycolatopsis lexingtonensis]|uniref:Excalibur calcium-binding domain-containing protein n=1 Tax=Amycolatopsis lexingtonensis TaxID=218822 RepID=A0ABR9IEJ6_9PSEU|nr:hypothetical protein [Amycolatopsis lexingtonensis]MBE1501594.1 hypothetical protein [Amycolatopsis lexingtonensis]